LRRFERMSAFSCLPFQLGSERHPSCRDKSAKQMSTLTLPYSETHRSMSPSRANAPPSSESVRVPERHLSECLPRPSAEHRCTDALHGPPSRKAKAHPRAHSTNLVRFLQPLDSHISELTSSRMLLPFPRPLCPIQNVPLHSPDNSAASPIPLQQRFCHRFRVMTSLCRRRCRRVKVWRHGLRTPG
jgi:hypothetical protein